MDTRKKLVEALNKHDDWYIDLYQNGDRFIGLMSLLDSIGNFTWINGNNLYELSSFSIPRSVYSNKCRKLSKRHKIFLADGKNKTNLTSLFNKYLEEYAPEIWMHSVLSAKQLGLNVEASAFGEVFHMMEKDEVIHTQMEYRVDDEESIEEKLMKYRVDDEESIEEKLVPDEIWDSLDDNINYIAADCDGSVYAYDVEPEMHDVKWVNYGNTFINLSYFKIMKNAKIHGVNWEDSLCIRPTKLKSRGE